MDDIWGPYFKQDSSITQELKTYTHVGLVEPEDLSAPVREDIKARNKYFFDCFDSLGKPRGIRQYQISPTKDPSPSTTLPEIVDDRNLENEEEVYGYKWPRHQFFTPRGVTKSEAKNFMQMLEQRRDLESNMEFLKKNTFRDAQREWQMHIMIQDARYLHRYLVWQLNTEQIRNMSERVAKLEYIFDMLLYPAKRVLDTLLEDFKNHEDSQ
ncbi:hypothetical protein EDC01DRAFT_630785 [Geopyxis carbonaria]|nr:hypothetical protein EDC01DRAFT_630785 [Geopyxis carbonaria]